MASTVSTEDSKSSVSMSTEGSEGSVSVSPGGDGNNTFKKWIRGFQAQMDVYTTRLDEQNERLDEQDLAAEISLGLHLPACVYCNLEFGKMTPRVGFAFSFV